jgi:hypothetical protein
MMYLLLLHLFAGCADPKDAADLSDDRVWAAAPLAPSEGLGADPWLPPDWEGMVWR